MIAVDSTSRMGADSVSTVNGRPVTRWRDDSTYHVDILCRVTGRSGSCFRPIADGFVRTRHGSKSTV